MTLTNLLYTLATEYHERNRASPGRTKLIKLAYIAEILYKRLTGSRLTDADWIFWHYGPYVMDYTHLLGTGPFADSSTTEDFKPVVALANHEVPQIQEDERIAVMRALKFADYDLNELLDFVYFDTEPMMNVKQRGDRLDFGCVLPEEAYSVKKYVVTGKAKNEIRLKLEKWKREHSER